MNKAEFDELIDTQLLIILIGNVGTGKTTIANYLESLTNGEVLSSDELNENRKVSRAKLIGYVSEQIENLLQKGKTVIVDGKNLSSNLWGYYSHFADRLNLSTLIIDCGVGNNDDLQRRKNNNRGQSDEYWSSEFEKNKEMYEKPSSKHKNQIILDRDDFYRLTDNE